MSNITEELDKIINAVYGKDVRQAIHDAIQQAYNDATSGNGDASLEVKLARGIYDNLNDRLNASDEQLADEVQYRKNDISMLNGRKADKSEVNELKSGKADLTYVDDKIKNLDGLQFKGAFNTLAELRSAYPEGTSGLFVIHANNHWYFWDGEDWKKGNELVTPNWSEYMYEDGERIA